MNTAQVIGEVQTQRLAIEDGAVLRGKVEAGKPVDKAADNRSAAVAMARKIIGASWDRRRSKS